MANVKLKEYRSLVDDRKKCTICGNGVTNPAACCDGQYDSSEIGPWSLWQGNLDARLMVVGQDWGGERSFIDDKGLDGPKNPTNLMLTDLLKEVGIAIGPPPPTREPQECRGIAFFTNAILCLKKGDLQAPVQRQWFDNCAQKFLLPLIRLIHPNIVVTLGEEAFRAIERARGLPHYSFREAVDQEEGFKICGDVRLFPRYHCGKRILNTHRNKEMQKQDWRRLQPFLKA